MAPSSTTAFIAHYQALIPERPALGTIAMIPWDTDIFGFRVADYKLGEPDEVVSCADRLHAALSAAAVRESLRLVACFVSPEQTKTLPVLTRMGFGFIELGLTATIADLQKHRLHSRQAGLRLSLKADCEAIEQIAANAFHSGRYSADPLIPPELSSRRYVFWVHDALSGRDSRDRMYVMGEPGDTRCFFHVRVEGESADLRLAAVRPDLQGGPIGFRLYQAVLQELHTQGVRHVTARLSANNTAVLNLYASLGFHFSHADVVLHWHPA